MSEEATPVVIPAGIMGYTDRVSSAPGESVALHVSTTADEWTAEFVRLHALSIPSAGIERREVPVEGVPRLTLPGIDQATAVGSFLRVPEFPAHPELTIALALMPTRVGDGAQVALAHRSGSSGWSIGLDASGRIELTAGESSLVVGDVVVASTWYEIRVTLASVITLDVRTAGTFEANRVVRSPAHWSGSLSATGSSIPLAGADLLWGCSELDAGGEPQHPFDGRVENPVIVADARAAGSRSELAAHPAVVAAWDIGRGIGPRGVTETSLVVDAGPGAHHGRTVNHPQRAVTASGWRGDVMDFRHAPAEYAAVHFHRDDMTDCGWVPQASIELPADLPSGVYGVRLRDTAGGDDTVPVFVRPADDAERAPILLVLPTNSYLAYGNDHVGVDSPRTQVWSQMVPTLDSFELFRNLRRELGFSLYEAHGDGYGVCYSSWRRPLLTLRERVYDHNAPVWQFTGDMQIVDWLDRTGRRFDVVTDLDLHRGGAELLSRYRAVITGTHPEYPSREILEAYETYAATGGRLIYTGGNGMYWVTGYDPEDEQVVEIRRWGATQAWLAPPGEYHLGFTGQQGGIWRFRGRAPQKSFGVGFVAAGNPGASAGYRRVAFDSATDWVFAGVDDRDFGDYGVSGGAAGLEIDSVSAPFGTSDEAIVLATSIGHNDDMLEARENFNMTSRILGGGRNPRVHSDLTLVPREGGGAVFSTGSIAFAGALYDLDGRSEVSTLFGNIVDRFVADGPILD